MKNLVLNVWKSRKNEGSWQSRKICIDGSEDHTVHIYTDGLKSNLPIDNFSHKRFAIEKWGIVSKKYFTE